MKHYCKKTKRTAGIFLFVSFICIAAFLFSSGFMIAKDKVKVECNKEIAVTAAHTAAVRLGEILKDIKSESWRRDIFSDNSLKIYIKEQEQKSLPAGARQFICSSNVTLQDLCVWIADGYKGLNTVREVLSYKRT